MSDDNKKNEDSADLLELVSPGELNPGRLEVRAQSVQAPALRAGDIRFKAGRLGEGARLPLLPEHGGAIVFELGDGTEVLRFVPDGKILVRGELVHDNQAAWAGLRAWLIDAKVLFEGDAKVEG